MVRKSTRTTHLFVQAGGLARAEERIRPLRLRRVRAVVKLPFVIVVIVVGRPHTILLLLLLLLLYLLLLHL